MQYIDGVYRNPDRTRKYGLDVGDRVKRTIRFKKDVKTIYGTVVSLKGVSDNNRVQVLWDGDKEPFDEVAEWCTLIDEEGLEINNIVWRVMQNFQRGKMSYERMEYLLEKELKITEAQMLKAFKSRPSVILEKGKEEWKFYIK